MGPLTEQLNERRQVILEHIVADYIRTAVPVASQQLVRNPVLNVSPATIRNDMAELEEMGFISRPHTSAGGVPENPAYRFYVERVPPTSRPSHVFQLRVRQSLQRGAGDLEVWVKEATAALSQAVQTVAIATEPRIFQARLRQVQLVQLNDRQALLVVVMQEARLRQHLIALSEYTRQEELSILASQLNVTFGEKSSNEIRTTLEGVLATDEFATHVIVEVARLMALEEEQESERHHIEGLRHMLGQPEFASGARARAVVAVLENEELVRQMMADGPEPGTVRVVIGDEHTSAGLRPYSIVLCRYGTPEYATGTIAALGPTRMDYSLAMASVRYIAELLSEMLATLHRVNN